MRLIDQAMMAHRGGNLAEAETFYRQALAADERDFDALHMLGIVHAQRGHFEEAERLLRSAIAIDPAVPPCLHNHGNMLSRLGRYEEALESYRKAIAIVPNYAPVYVDLGSAQSALGLLDASLASHDIAVKLDPRSAKAHYNRGITLFKLGRPDAALESYNRAIMLDRNHAEAHTNRGSIFCSAQIYAEALAAYDKAIAINPKLAEAWVGRGNVFLGLERYDDALSAYQRALSIQPDLAGAWIGRRNIAAAREHYDKDNAAHNLKTVEFMPRGGSPLAVQIEGETSGRTVKLVADPIVCPFVLTRHRWQVGELEFAKRVCGGAEPITLVDVGANMGLFSRQLLIALPAIVEAFAYEPESQNYTCLVHNLAPFRGRVTPIEAALSDKAGKMEFYLDPTNSGNFSLTPDAMPTRYFKTTVEAKDTTAESAAWMRGGRRIFYKSDAEGFDELIATAVQPEVWSQVFAGFIEIWRIKKPPFDVGVFASILDSFPNKIFLGNADTGVSETSVSTTDVLNYIKIHDHAHVDLGFWR
jgi:FkbM family methyltransferase